LKIRSFINIKHTLYRVTRREVVLTFIGYKETDRQAKYIYID